MQQVWHSYLIAFLWIVQPMYKATFFFSKEVAVEEVITGFINCLLIELNNTLLITLQIMTDRHLRVLDTPLDTVYALGDCADIQDYGLPCTAQVGTRNT